MKNQAQKNAHILSILNVVESDCGITLDSNLNPVNLKAGYVVSIEKYGVVKTYFKNYFAYEGVRDFYDYLKSVKSVLKNSNHFLGLWRSGDKVYYDVNIITLNPAHALKLARDNHQKAIYNLSNGKTILTNYETR